MELEKSNYQEGKFRKFIPRKQINEGWHYYKLADSNSMIGVRVNVKEVFVVCEKGGQPVINEKTKTSVFEWNNQEIETRVLTREQYEQIQQSGFEEE